MELSGQTNSDWILNHSWDEEPKGDKSEIDSTSLPDFSEKNVKKSGSPIFMIVFDCELAGPCLRKNALINLGASCVNCSDGKELASIDLYFAMPKEKEWDEKTVKEFWSKQDHLKDLKKWIDEGNGKTCEQAMKEFVEFLNKCHELSHGDICIAADHADVDSSWVNLYLSQAGYSPLHMIFGYFNPVISLYSYYLGLSQHTLESWISTKRIVKRFSATEAAMRHLQLKTRPHITKHHLALSDARSEIGNYRSIAPFLQHMKKSVGHQYWFRSFCQFAHLSFIPALQLSSQIEFPPLQKTK